jgi:NADPH:quinone reductase-like Zn-dependent oxidoreductase
MAARASRPPRWADEGFALDSFDAPPAGRDDLPEPEPADGQVLVRVLASSVNPVDAAIASGVLRDRFEYEFPVVIGRDFAGAVERDGGGFAVGEEVLGALPHADPAIQAGTWAEPTVAGPLHRRQGPADTVLVIGRPAG